MAREQVLADWIDPDLRRELSGEETVELVLRRTREFPNLDDDLGEYRVAYRYNGIWALPPVWMWDEPDEVLISGGRRMTAAHREGYTHLPAWLVVDE